MSKVAQLPRSRMPRHRMLGAYDRLAFACSRRRKLSASLSFLVLMLLFSVAGSQEAPIPPRNVPEVSVRPAEERDCSHLTGRLFADCLCQGALPGARNFWKAGDVLAAFAAARPCDKSSPGLDNVDRVLLHALHASATRARTGLELARQGQMLEAVTAFSELFAEAKKVPETPKGLLRGPLAHAHCRWWVITMRHETLAGVPAHPHLSALAERVGEVCAEALSDVVNSTRLQPGSTEFEGFAHRFPRQREPSESGVSEGSHTGLQIDWPKSEGPPAPWLLAARLLSLVAMGKPEQAVQEARANGASLEAGGLDFPEFISRLSAPAAVSNSSWHHSMRTRKTPKLWSMASLLLCKRWQGLRLKVCQPCSGMGVQLLFSVRTGVPVLAECNTAKGRLRGLWRRVLGHRNVLPAAFSHRVLASVWGEVLALDCIERYRHAAGAEEDTTAERRRCLIQAREATRHAGDASAALTVQAVHAFEAGDGDEFLHAMDLLVESETWSAPRGEAADGHAAHSRGGGPGLGLSENVAKVGWRGLHVLLHAVSSLQSMGSWPLALQQQAHGESAQASRLAALVALGNSGLRALLLRLKAVARSMEQWRGRMYSDDHKGIGLSPTVEMVLGKMRLMTRNRRYEVLLLWYMQSLLKAGRVQEAAGTGLAFVDARKEQMQNASSEPLTAPTPHQPSSSAQRDDPKRKDPHVRESPGGLEELASMLSLLESAERALQWAEALERSPRGGDEQPWLWPRERKWHSASRRDNNTSVHQRLRAVHTQHANETLAQLAYAVDAIAQKSAAVASIKDVAAAGGASKVRRAGAMLGVAVEVEKWRWLLAARLQRLLAHPARCMFASLHALALQDDGMSWLEGASSVATARVYTHVQTSLRSEETKALRERLVRYEKYRNTARAAQGMRAKHDTRRRSIAEAWGLEVLSDCLEGHGISRLSAPDHGILSWRSTRLPMLKDVSVLLVQRIGLIAVDRPVALRLKIEAGRVAAGLIASSPSHSCSVLGRLLGGVGGQLVRESATAIWWGAVLVPMRTLVWMLLHVREGSIRAYAHAHNGAVHARDLTRAGLVRASGGLEWVQAGGLQALWEERRLRVERRVASFRFGVVKWYDVLVMRWWSWRLATANLYAQIRDTYAQLVQRARARREEWRQHVQGLLQGVSKLLAEIRAEAQRRLEACMRQSQGWHSWDGGGGSRRGQHTRNNKHDRSKTHQGRQRPAASAGRRTSKCKNSFKGMSDDAVMRLFSSGSGILGAIGCSRKSARKKFHTLSLQHHPDKAGTNKMDKSCAEENFMDLQAAYTRAQALCF